MVLDPFMGSGTTAEVALATGRAVVGFEVEAKYIDIAASRLDRFEQWQSAYRAQQTLPILEEHEELATLNFG